MCPVPHANASSEGNFHYWEELHGGEDLFSAIRANEVVMGMQMRAAPTFSFTPPRGGSFRKQPVSLMEM